jgi:hypothetical protein
MKYLNTELMNNVDVKAFQNQKPFPFMNERALLKDEAYKILYEEWPDMKHFEKNFNMDRGYGQDSHNRYILRYRDLKNKNAVSKHWHSFIAELNNGEYKKFIAKLFGVSPMRIIIDFYWHATPTGASVSPHVDSINKLGPTLFYFNNTDVWDESWGGQTIALDDGGKFAPWSGPKWDDFENQITAKCVDNHFFIFERNCNSWHGVKEIIAPEGQYRKMFLVPAYDRFMMYEKKITNFLGVKNKHCEF